MGCQSEVLLANNLTFTITTHDPDTGVLTDADAAPVYRVYEDETTAAILTGTMATLDAANTTGFYSERIACTAANGFEIGKSYNIYAAATVGGDTGGISFGFLVSLFYDVVSIGPELRVADELLPIPRAAEEMLPVARTADVQLPIIRSAQEL